MILNVKFFTIKSAEEPKDDIRSLKFNRKLISKSLFTYPVRYCVNFAGVS